MNKTQLNTILILLFLSLIILGIPFGDSVLKVLIIVMLIVLTIGTYIYQKASQKPNNVKKEKNYEKIDTKTCPICNTINNDKRVYCRHCNTPIRNIICPVCQKENPFDQKYCTECDSILRNKTRY